MHVADLEAQAEAGLTISPDTQKAAALRVLVSNPELAFAPSEIAARADIPPENAPTVCSRLAEMGAAATANGYYYLPQDEATAATIRQALGSAHQRDLAGKTATADAAALADESGDAGPGSLSDDAVDAELADLDDVSDS